MTPELADKLRKAHEALAGARTILSAGLPGVAAREAYVALFHGAQAALLSQGIFAKTHSGVRGEFGRLALAETMLGDEAGRILADGYRFKEISDYRIVATAEAERIIAGAGHVLARIERWLDR